MYPNTMGVNFTAPQLAAINGAFDTIITTIRAVKEVNLSPAEREGANSISNERQPYVDRTIRQHVVNYPGLVVLPNVATTSSIDYGMWQNCANLLVRWLEVEELLKDMGMSAGRLAFKFMRNVYDYCERYKDEASVLGAQTVYSDLYELFRHEQNPQPPA